MARIALAKPAASEGLEPRYRPAEYKRLRSKLYVDGMRLGEEFMEHPNLVMDIGEFCAGAIFVRDKIANDYKVILAAAANDLREQGAKSEAQVNAQLSGHEWVKGASNELEQAKLDAALWQALSAAAVAKTSALKHLSELTVSGWLTPNSMGANRQAARETGKPNQYYHGNKTTT